MAFSSRSSVARSKETPRSTSSTWCKRGTPLSPSLARVCGKPGLSVMASPRMSTTPSSNLSFALAVLTCSSSSAEKWVKIMFCRCTGTPRSRLRKDLTSLSGSMPQPTTASSPASRYAVQRSWSSALALSPSASRMCALGGCWALYCAFLSISTDSRIAFRPYLVSTSKALRSDASAARRSAFVSAPSCCSRLATVLAKRRSPPHAVMMRMYSGPQTWLERWLRPHCWMHWSADHGSSSVMCTRLRWLGTRRSAWSEIPLDAASEMMATSCGGGTRASGRRRPQGQWQASDGAGQSA